MVQRPEAEQTDPQSSDSAAAPPPFKSGFVAVLGLPNAGKSTLVNTLVGRKVAIVSPRPQTTRNRILGIVQRPHAQIVLVDTPGIHLPRNALGRWMVQEIEKGSEGVDLIAYVVDVTREFGSEDAAALERIRKFSQPAFLVLNKIDRIEKARLLPLIDRYRGEHRWAEIIPISALTGEGVDRLERELLRYLPEGEPYFPTDQFTDQPERFLAAEIIREKAMLLTRQEVPYSIGVAIERYEESDRLVRISATLLVEREGQRGILIGRGGSLIKKIGTLAREELEWLLGTKVFLELYVKVQPDWRDNPALISELDWRRQFERLSRRSE